MAPVISPTTRRPVDRDLSAVEQRLRDVLRAESAHWSTVDRTLEELPLMLLDYLRRGGKRLRPAFLLAGLASAGDDAVTPDAIDVAAALELLHVFALIHDDVMDGSATRRGEPALHVALEEEHRRQRGRGESRRYGEGMAVLAGDLALVYADRLIPADGSVRALWDELRVELTMGQYLDLQGAGLGVGGPDRARRIATLKSGRYTIVRPLHLATALSRRADLIEPFTLFGEPLGRAFQLRDDMLGAFGSSTLTGKPSGDDLREAKPTLLLELARRRASSPEREVLATVGRTDLDERGIEEIRNVLVGTGAVAEVEREIERDAAAASDALATAPIHESGRALLEELARTVVDRAA